MFGTATTAQQVPMTTLLTGLGREATARVRRAMRPLGLGAQQFMLLEQLALLGRASQAELAEALAIDPSNLATLVADLCDRELVERTRDDADRRRYVLRLSRAGTRLLRRTEGAIDTAEDDLLKPLSAAQREQLYTLLRQLADGVELCPSADHGGALASVETGELERAES
jgi:MarR family transcriptional regulator, lower aerobic nicotinate degradation pathway regulator